MLRKDIQGVEVIGFDSGWGCRDYRCEDGPAAVNASSLIAKLAALGVPTTWRGPLGLKHLGARGDMTSKLDTLPQTVTGLRRLSDTVKHAMEDGRVPVVIGGDHSSAIGTFAGAVAATKSFGRFGLIWLDAHLDAHTFETSHEGKWGGWWHGQPVTALMGHGLPEFRNIGGFPAKMSPEHLSIIGPHSYEPGERAFVEKYGIRVFFLDEVKRRGFRACFTEALARANTGTDAFGLTVDLDSFQPQDAPGVGTTEDEGLVAAEVVPILKSVARHPRFAALEIAEFNPYNDKLNKTGQLIENIIESAFS
ncbi:MAG TPA: arginase [Patescibacteria group bacterium]|nr:arginase [Patescibacteria group bacterium]